LVSPRVSVSEVVRRVVSNHPSILDCLKLGVVNYSSLARMIADDVRRGSGLESVNVNAIKMSLIRFSERLREASSTMEERVRHVLAGTTIELQTDLKVITVRREALIYKLNELMDKISRARFFQLTQGTKTFTVIIAREVSDDVIELMGRDAIEEVIDDQSAIILISPKEIIETTGVIAYIASLLSWHGVNITQIISCYVDTVLVLNRRDVFKAYQLIEEAILQIRKSIPHP